MTSNIIIKWDKIEPMEKPELPMGPYNPDAFIVPFKRYRISLNKLIDPYVELITQFAGITACQKINVYEAFVIIGEAFNEKEVQLALNNLIKQTFRDTNKNNSVVQTAIDCFA